MAKNITRGCQKLHLITTEYYKDLIRRQKISDSPQLQTVLSLDAEIAKLQARKDLNDYDKANLYAQITERYLAARKRSHELSGGENSLLRKGAVGGPLGESDRKVVELEERQESAERPRKKRRRIDSPPPSPVTPPTVRKQSSEDDDEDEEEYFQDALSEPKIGKALDLQEEQLLQTINNTAPAKQLAKAVIRTMERYPKNLSFGVSKGGISDGLIAAGRPIPGASVAKIVNFLSRAKSGRFPPSGTKSLLFALAQDPSFDKEKIKWNEGKYAMMGIREEVRNTRKGTSTSRAAEAGLTLAEAAAKGHGYSARPPEIKHPWKLL